MSAPCQACGGVIPPEHAGHGRRFCLTCSPPVAAAGGRTCAHGTPIKMACEVCSWEQGFRARRIASHDAAMQDGMTADELHEADVTECQRALRREVAAVRRLDLDDDERDRRLEVVRDQIKTEIADVETDWDWANGKA